MPERSPSRRRKFPNGWFVVAGLIAVTWVVYWPVLRFEFVDYDDGLYVVENTHVKAGVTVENIRWALRTRFLANWQPLMWLSLMADAELYGAGAGGYHLTNLIIHTANVVLLFVFLRTTTGSDGKAAVVAALFAVHPLHVESVAWVSERKDVLSTLLGLVCLLGYQRYARTGRWGWYFGALAAFVCSLSTKAMLVTMPFLLLLLDYWPLRRTRWNVPAADRSASATAGRTEVKTADSDSARLTETTAVSWRALLVEKLPFFVLTLIFCIIAYGAQAASGAMPTLEQHPLSVRIMNAVLVYGLYLSKTAWPTDLAVFYPHAGAAISPAAVAVSAAVLLGITAAVLWQWRRRPALLVGWFWYLGTLVPVIGLVQIGAQQMADRYTYVPLIGLFVAVTFWVGSMRPNGTLVVWAPRVMAGLAVLVCMILARQQVLVWKDSETLFAHTLAVTERNAVAHYLMGLVRNDQQRFAEAADHFRTALEIEPQYADAHNDLGVAVYSQGNLSEAAAHFGRAIAIEPDHVKALVNLGVALYQLQQPERGFACLERAVRLDPENVNAHVNLGNALESQQQYGRATDHFRRATELDPSDWLPHYKLAIRLHAAGDRQAARAAYATVLRLNPELADAHYRMGILALERGQTRVGIGHLQAALRAAPDHQAASELLRQIAEPPAAPH